MRGQDGVLDSNTRHLGIIRRRERAGAAGVAGHHDPSRANQYPSAQSRHFPLAQVAPLALVVLAAVLGLGMRLFLAAHFFGNNDEANYEIVARIVRSGGNVYAETSRYNYSPLWAWCLYGFDALARVANLPFHLVVRCFLTLVDLGNASLIAVIAGRLGLVRREVAFAAYLLNPVAVLTVGFHGQFDSFAVLPLLVGTYFSIRGPHPASRAGVWALATLAVLVKQIVVFGAWTLIVYTYSGWRRIAAMGLASLVFAASFVPYLPGGAGGILRNVVLYDSGAGFYGFGLLPASVSRPLFFGVMLALPFVVRDRQKRSLPRAMELSMVAMLAFIYGIAQQYFILPVMFGSIFPSLPYSIYSGVATLILLTSPANINLLPVPVDLLLVWLLAWNAVWATAITWFVTGVRRPSPVSANAPGVSTGPGPRGGV